MRPARAHSGVSDPTRLGLHDHVGWCYDGDGWFDDVALPYMTEGLRRSELVCCVTDDPSVGDRLGALGDFGSMIDKGALLVASVEAVYGTLEDPTTTATLFARFVERSRKHGYSGVRLASDVTTAVRRMGADRWVWWERTVDATIATHAVVVLCAYDRRRLDAATVSVLGSVHPAVSERHGDGGFRVFTEGGAVHVTGSVDAFSAPRLARVLRASLRDGPLVVDLSAAEYLDHCAFVALHRIAADGTPVVVHHGRPVHRSIWQLLELPPVDLRFE